MIDRVTPKDTVAHGSALPGSDAPAQTLPLHAEEISVSRRRVEKALVRALRTTHTRDVLVDEELSTERVEIERVPIGRVVETMPAIREEGDTTIIPVVEEVVVVERRLMLKEEVRLRRVKTTEHHVETVVVREQKVSVTRTQAGTSPIPAEPP